MDIYAYPMLVWNARKNANWRLAFPLAAACVTCMPLGVYTLSVLDGDILKRLIGVACLGGECFGAAGGGFIRLSSSLPTEELLDAIDFLEQAFCNDAAIAEYLNKHTLFRLEQPY